MQTVLGIMSGERDQNLVKGMVKGSILRLFLVELLMNVSFSRVEVFFVIQGTERV